MVYAATRPAVRAEQRPVTLTILQRLRNQDNTAVKDCLDVYGPLIWALSKKYTSSLEEAEAATQEIFRDVWRYALQSDETPYVTEGHLISRIAWRRLKVPIL